MSALDVATGGAALRKQLAAGLKPLLPKSWIIFPDAQPVNAVARPTLLMQRSALVKSTGAPGWFESTYSLLIVSDQTIAETREDYLDNLLEELIEGLDTLLILWSRAERGVFNGTNPSYSVTMTAINNRPPKES